MWIYDVDYKMSRPSITAFHEGLILKDFDCGTEEVKKKDIFIGGDFDF